MTYATQSARCPAAYRPKVPVAAIEITLFGFSIGFAAAIVLGLVG